MIVELKSLNLCEIESWENTTWSSALSGVQWDYRPKFNATSELLEYMPIRNNPNDYELRRCVRDGKIVLEPRGSWSPKIELAMSLLKFSVEENRPKTEMCYLKAVACAATREIDFVSGVKTNIILDHWDIIFVNDPVEGEVLVGALYFDEVDKNGVKVPNSKQYKTSWRWRN